MNRPKLKEDNRKNKRKDLRTLQVTIFLSNTWMTFFAPLAISLFAGRLLIGTELSASEKTLFAITAILHIGFAIILYLSAHKRALSLEIDDLIEKNEEYENEITPFIWNIYNTSQLQQEVIYKATIELEEIISEFNEIAGNSRLTDEDQKAAKTAIDELLDDGIDRILSILNLYRKKLFDYSGSGLYNICLYLHDEGDDMLHIIWRKYDDRLAVTGRPWKPGHGHVGLTFIQNELKICDDISKSTELSQSAVVEGDELKYKSFLSVPIRDASKNQSIDDDSPIGVLVFTSSEENQFSLERDKLFALTIAKILFIHIDKYLKTI